MKITDFAAFVRDNTRLMPVPHTPEISLYVADEATSLWQKTEEELGEIGLPPPFWAFAWAGGQALARYVLDHPETVRGKHVLDFASGSGLVAIAAAKAGARKVDACDIDAFAGEAIAMNARVNGVSDLITVTLSDVIGSDSGWETVLAGDICYQRDLAERVTDWLATLARQNLASQNLTRQNLGQSGACVLIGDPGRSYLPRSALVEIMSYQVPVARTLEDADIKKSSVWRFAQ
jgi:predicted nicotinamide N-methyase